MSTTFTAPTRTRPTTQAPPRDRPAQPRRRSFTEQRRAARRAAADRSLRAQLVKGRSLVQLVVTSRGRDSRWPFVAAFALIAAVSVIALLMVNTATAQTSFTERALTDELHGLTLQEQQLQQQVAAKQAPGQLAASAQELGMQPGANPGNLVINADGSVTWIEPSPPPAPPAPAPAEPAPAPAEAAEPAPAPAEAAVPAPASAEAVAPEQAPPPQQQGPAQDPAQSGPTQQAAPAADPAQQAGQPATGGA